MKNIRLILSLFGTLLLLPGLGCRGDPRATTRTYERPFNTVFLAAARGLTTGRTPPAIRHVAPGYTARLEGAAEPARRTIVVVRRVSDCRTRVRVDCARSPWEAGELKEVFVAPHDRWTERLVLDRINKELNAIPFSEDRPSKPVRPPKAAGAKKVVVERKIEKKSATKEKAVAETTKKKVARKDLTKKAVKKKKEVKAKLIPTPSGRPKLRKYVEPD